MVFNLIINIAGNHVSKNVTCHFMASSLYCFLLLRLCAALPVAQYRSRAQSSYASRQDIIHGPAAFQLYQVWQKSWTPNPWFEVLWILCHKVTYNRRSISNWIDCCRRKMIFNKGKMWSLVWYDKYAGSLWW